MPQFVSVHPTHAFGYTRGLQPSQAAVERVQPLGTLEICLGKNQVQGTAVNRLIVDGDASGPRIAKRSHESFTDCLGDDHGIEPIGQQLAQVLFIRARPLDKQQFLGFQFLELL